MQIKKITLITLFTAILLICSLSTISAANQTINSTSTGGIAQGITGTGTGETLFLQPGTYNKTGQDINININKNITIQGNGPQGSVIIDAQGKSRIFTTTNNTNLTFINITFLNGYATGSGGAIQNGNSGTMMTFINCTFVNNTAVTHGGAIYSNGANLTVSGNTFVNNTAAIHGGAVYSNGANLTVSGNTFVNNTAATYGGAVYNDGANLTVSDNNFTNNTGANGAAIHSRNINGVISNNVFTNNTGNYGAGVYNIGLNITVSGNTFVNNTAAIHGGAIYSNNVSVIISGNTFINNNAKQLGGAICSNIDGNVTVSGNTFVNNTAATYGGAVYNAGNMSVVSNTMSGNTADLGQMIYNNGTMGILNLIYLSNSTIKTSKGSNVLIYATLTDDMGNTVTGQAISFYVDGVFVANVTSVEGKASTSYLVTQDPVSVLPVTGDYAGHEGYSILLKNGELLVPKISTNITIDVPEDIRVGQNTTLKSKLTDKDGNPIANATIDFYVDGKKVGSAVTDKDGIAKLNYIFTKSGKSTITAKYPGNDTYLASSASTQTQVSKIKTKITIKKEGDKITATLTDENGNPIAGKKLTFRIKGVVIGVGITDANGQVVIYYKNANKKAVTVSFAGDEQYAPASATSTPISDNVQASGKVAMKETGIPVLAVLLALITSIGFLRYRKMK